MRVFYLRALLIVLAPAVFLAGCHKPKGPTSQQVSAATEQASDLLVSLSKCDNGPQAEIYKARIFESLKNVGGLEAIKTDNTDLDSWIRAAYGRQAFHDLNVLRHTMDDYEQAKAVKDDFISSQQKSGESFFFYETNESDLQRYLAKSYLLQALKQGAVLRPADYYAAGLPVPPGIGHRVAFRKSEH